MLQTISFLRTQHRPSITKQKRKHVCDASLQRGNPEAYSEFFSFILRLRAVKTHFGISSEQKTLFTIVVSKDDASRAPWALSESVSFFSGV